MFAMRRLSRGLKGLGDLGVLLLLDRSDSDTGENCSIISDDFSFKIADRHRLFPLEACY
jgi:hypothetical protein